MKTKYLAIAGILILGVIGGFVADTKVSAAGPDAQFISQNVPTTLTVGQKVTVSITMKNTGTTTWGNGDYGYKLGSQNPRDNTTWGYGRMYLQKTSVAPGEQTTFSYSITAPSQADTYNFQWQMVDDGGNGWFGPLTQNVAIKVNGTGGTPTPTPSKSPTPTPTSGCPNPPTIATFNPYPIDFSFQDSCSDLPLLSGKRTSGGSYPSNQTQRLAGVTAKAGDEVTVRIYVHDGAAVNLDPNRTTAFNTRVTIQVPDMIGDGRTLAATVQADSHYTSNRIVEPINDNMRLTTGPLDHVEIIAGSGQITDPSGHVVASNLLSSATVQTIPLGDMLACFEHYRIITFRVRVIGPTATATPSKTPTPSPAPIVCQINNATNRTIYKFPNPGQNYLLASGTNAQAIVGPYNFSLAAGTYRVTLNGYDDHTESNQNQPNEQFQVVLKRVYETRLATSNASPDIANNSQYSLATVGEITLSEAATTITAIHAAYPGSNPNSITPVCAAFDLISTPPTPSPAIHIVKTSSVTSLPFGGGNVTYGYSVTNTGNVSLSNVSVTDNKCSPVNRTSGDSNSNNILETSETWTYTCTTNINQTTTNIGTASGMYGSSTVTDTDTKTVTVGNPSTLSCIPGSQTRQINQSASVSATGGTGTYSWSAPGGNPTGGNGTNFTTVYGTAGSKTITVTSGNQTDTCIVDVTINPSPAIHIVKTSSVTSLPFGGGNVTYGYSVTNTGNVSLSNVSVTDNKCSPVNRTSGDSNSNNILETSETWTYTCTTNINQTTTNIGTASGMYGSSTVTDTDTKTVTVGGQNITTPTINAYCSGNTSKATINWSEAGRGANGYYIDLDNDNNWSNGFWNKFVPTGTTSTIAPDGFNPMGGVGALTLLGNASYTVRVYYAATGEHSPIANFTANTCSTGVPIIAITKLVRNISQGGGESDTVSARPNETVEFVLRVRNDGNANATNVRVSDILPAGLLYQIGSSDQGDGIVNGGVTIGTLTPGQTLTIRLRATVRDDSYFNYGTVRLTNTAYASADTLATVNDTAYVDVMGNQFPVLTCTPANQNTNVDQTVYLYAQGGNGSYTWTAYGSNSTSGTGSSFNVRYSTGGTYDAIVRDGNGQTASCRIFVSNNNQNNIFIDKLVRNLSNDTGEYNTVSARANNTLEFVLRVTVNSNSTNIRVSDYLPSGLRYVSGSTRVDGNYVSDGITSGGITLGNQYGSRTYIVRLQAIVDPIANCTSSYCYANTVTLTNTAYASADGAGTVNDTAFINVTGDTVVINPSGQLSLQKLGKNVSKGDLDYLSTVIAAPNDTIDFIIKVRNISGSTINNVIVRDLLPSNIQYIQRTTAVNNIVVGDERITSSGINVGTLTPNQEVTVRLSAVIYNSASFAKGLTSVTNLAYARGDSAAEISAQLPISIYNGSVLGGIVDIKTGASGLFGLGVLLTIILTTLYMAYTSTGFFKKREAWTLANKSRTNKDKFNFAG